MKGVGEKGRKALSGVITLFFTLLVIVTFGQVVFRYVIGYSLYWSEEAARYLFVWISFLGAVLALGKGVHIGMDVIVEKLPGRVRKGVLLFSDLSVLAFLGFLTVKGTMWAMENMIQRSPALQVSMGLIFLAIPVGACLMGIVTAVRLAQRLRGRSEGGKASALDSIE
jgi:TRAP-type transport system small permease protein